MPIHQHKSQTAPPTSYGNSEQMKGMMPPPLQLSANDYWMGPEDDFSSSSLMDDHGGTEYYGPGGDNGVHEAEPEAKLPSGDVAKAKKWAEKSGIGAEAITQLQGLVGAPKTGVYDDATVQGVYLKQLSENEGKKHKGKENGIANESFFRKHGLIFTKTIENGKAMPEFVKAFLNDDGTPKASFASGITIGVYTHYDNQSPNNKTFWQVAKPWAKHNQAIGLNEDGEMEVGKPIKITEVGQIIESVQSISRGLEQLWMDGMSQGWIETDAEFDPNQPPAWTKVKDLGIFAHGMPYGIGVDSDKDDQYKHGLLSSSPDSYRSAPNIASFAEGLNGAIKSDINVLLFACNGAREYDEESPFSKADNSHRKRPDGQDMGDDSSFAAMLQEELGEESSVYGHLTAGHTTNNFTSMVYGKAAGPDGKKHMFDVLYPDSFIDSEMARLFGDLTDEEKAIARPLLRAQMWAHYKDSISDEYLRQAGKKKVKHWKQPKPTPEQIEKGETPATVYRELGPKAYEKGIPDLGAEMFTNPEECRELMNGNFQEVWMNNDRVEEIRKQAKA